MATEKKTVFVCRKCKQPVEVDPTLFRIDRALLKAGERSLDTLLLPERVSFLPGSESVPVGLSQSAIAPGSTGPSSLTEFPSHMTQPSGKVIASSRHSESPQVAMSLSSSVRFGTSGRHKLRESTREGGGGNSGSRSSQETVAQLLGKSYNGSQLPLLNVSESGQHGKASHSKTLSHTGSMRSLRRSKRERVNHKTMVPPGAPAEGAGNNAGLSSFVMASTHGVTVTAQSHSFMPVPSGLSQSVIPAPASPSKHTAASPTQASLGANSSSSSEGGTRSLTPASPVLASGVSVGSGQQQVVARKDEDQRERERSAAELFALVADLTLIDQPLCSHCAQRCLSEMQQELEQLQDEAQKYEEYDKQLEASITESNKQQELEAETQALKVREEELRQELRNTAQKKMRVQKQRMVAEQRLKTLQDLELKYWQQFNYHQKKLLQQQEDIEMMTAALRCKQSRLETLCKVNILNDAFHISHNGHFGTINGYRLGRMASIPVSWDENNAALGFVAILVNTIAKILGFRSHLYQIIPRGSNSRVVRFEPGSSTGTVNDLCGDSGRILWGRHFDAALVSFLAYVSELIGHCQRIDPSFHPPYAISQDSINGISIKMSKEDLQWTRALKFLLTNVKWLVAWVSTRPRR